MENTVMVNLSSWKNPRECCVKNGELFIEMSPQNQVMKTTLQQNKMVEIILAEKGLLAKEVAGEDDRSWFVISVRHLQYSTENPVALLTLLLGWSVEESGQRKAA